MPRIRMKAICYRWIESENVAEGWPLWPVGEPSFNYDLKTLQPQPAPIIAGWIAKYPGCIIRYYKIRDPKPRSRPRS